jgi:hypothetical protein
MLPITDEQARLGQELVKAARESGSYIADIFGDLPRNLMGLLIGDRVKARRIENAINFSKKLQERLENQAAEEPPSLKLAIPILAAAIDEENEGLQDLWVELPLFDRTVGY